jgi:hypothetical protein
MLHQPADDIAAHPAKADHAELHLLSLYYFLSMIRSENRYLLFGIML